MKLLYCKTCGDIFNLTTAEKICTCTESRGYYINAIVALINGPCLALGFDNREFYRATRADLDVAKRGVEFLAFIIPESASSVERVERVGDK